MIDLSFLKEKNGGEEETSGDFDLSFLEPEEPSQSLEKPSLWQKTKGFFTGEGGEDPLAFLEEKKKPQKIVDYYVAKDIPREVLKKMSVAERMEYAQDLKREREFRQSTGFTKGAASGASFSLSEHIPGLKPDEDDLLFGLGQMVGTAIPASLIYGQVGAPLVAAASQSIAYRGGLMALARLTGMGLTGATNKGVTKLAQHEIPTVKELAEEAAWWAAIDAGLQTVGLGLDFKDAINRLAQDMGVPTKSVLNELIDTIIVKAKPGIKPSEITPADAEAVYNFAKKSAPPVVEVAPEGIKQPTEAVGPGEAVAKESLADQIVGKEGQSLADSLFGKEYENLTPAEKDIMGAEMIIRDPSYPEEMKEQARHALQVLRGNIEHYEPQEAIAVSEKEEEPVVETFTTSKGSTYQVNEDGTTTRMKAPRGEHPGEEGLQPQSEKTWYVTPEDSLKLGEIQTKGEGKKIVELPNGQLGVQYTGGKDAGKIEKRTLVDYSKQPKEGMIPVESWKSGEQVHFGNEITQVQGARAKKTKAPLSEEVLKSEPVEAEAALPKKRQVPPKQTRPLRPVVGKKQAVARSKIIELFRTAFNDPIRLGKISQKRAAGIHKLWPKVTRLLKDNDVETAAHEIGHNLHTTLYGGDANAPQEQAKNISKALAPYLDELKPLAHYEPWGMEGFAEFTRLYVTNPDVALELAPKFYAKFEADLDAQYPEMKNALLEAREYYDAYLQGTPQSRIRAQTSYGSDKGKLANIVDAVKKNLNLDYLKTQFLDDVYPAKRLVAEAFGIPLSEVENLKDEANLYRSLRVLKGAVGKGDVFVLHETFNAKTLDKINGSLKDILKQLPNEEAYREFNDYLIARRAIEKSTQQIDTGINLGDALIVEKELNGKYGELAEQLDKYNNTLLKYAEDAGLISPEQKLMIKKNNVMYVPFQRVMEPGKGGGAATGAGRLQAGKPIKRMKGSTRDIIAPLESILKNTYSIIINAEKNLAGQVLAKIAKKQNVGAYVEAVPTPLKLKGKIEGEQVARDLAKRFESEGLDDLIEYDADGKVQLREDIADAIPDVFLRFGAGQYPAGENIVTVYVDGKPKYYQVSPEIFEMWTKGMAPYTAGLLTKILRIPAKTLRAGAILNPRFIQKNIIRDTWGSWLFTKYGKSVKDPVGLFIDTIYSPLAMLATSAGKGELYVEWLKSGGGMSTMQSLDREGIVKKLDEVRHGYKPYNVVKWLKHVAEISEEANRLSEFGKALAVEGKTRLGREIAAFAARDLSIDFAKMGLQTKVLNQIIPFFNATIQGGDKLLRTLGNAEDRKNFLPRILGFIALPSLMLAWLNKDDDNVKEFYEEEKDFNFIVPVNGEYLKIPVPFETGVLAHGLTQRMYNYFMKNDPEAFEQFMGSILSAMLPSFIPAFANPFMEAWANKNFFTGGRIIPSGKEDLVAKYQYKNNTSSTARLLGRAMTYMLGQDTRSKAASPAVIDHFINAWGGGLGHLMIRISDASLEAAGQGDKIPGPQQAITERFGLDAFTARFPRASTRSIERFYDNYADATARRKSFKHAEKMNLETEEELEQAYQRFDKIYDYNTLQMAYKAIQQCQREINNIWNDSTIDPELKKEMIDDLYFQQIEFAKAANEDIRQYRLAD